MAERRTDALPAPPRLAHRKQLIEVAAIEAGNDIGGVVRGPHHTSRQLRGSRGLVWLEKWHETRYALGVFAACIHLAECLAVLLVPLREAAVHDTEVGEHGLQVVEQR